MKVALISHSFPPFMTGGIGSYTFSLAKALSKKGIEVTVFCGGKVKIELESDFKIRRLPMLDFPPRSVWFQIQNYRKLTNELKEFDIIHGQNTTSTSYLYMKRRIKKPWIVSFHDCPSRGLRAFIDSPLKNKNIGDFIFNVIEYPLYKRLYLMDIKNADRAVVVSNSLLTDLKEQFDFDTKKVRIIQNGVDLQKIERISRNLKPKKKGQKRIIFLGRLFYSKGLTFLVEAMKGVVKYDPSVVLEVYGDGPMKKYLQNQVIENKLSDNVHLNNSAPNEQIIQEISNSNILILPSLYEAFPIVLLEAMACKKPVITSNVSGMKELIENTVDGILVPPKEPLALSNAIIHLLKNPKISEKMGEKGYKKVKENFTWDMQVNKTIQVYHEVIQEYNKQLKNAK